MLEANQHRLFCSVNQSLGTQPTLGPIPTNLLAPSLTILVCSYFVTQVLLGLGFAAFLLSTAWLICTWWVVVGEKTWKFTNKLVPVPNWIRGYVPYRHCLPQSSKL
ncbi:MAG: hypothetical protein AAFO06_24330 [Cyanobacteria bacterium J06597_16]